jgi:hypothetical protein
MNQQRFQIIIWHEAPKKPLLEPRTSDKGKKKEVCRQMADLFLSKKTHSIVTTCKGKYKNGDDDG